MNIAPFKVEEWMNAWETKARYNIAETCVDSVSLDELFQITGEDPDAFWKSFRARRLTYGDIEGSEALKRGIAGLYRTVRPGHIVPTHGAAGANHHIFYSLLQPGDEVISVMPTYQQLYSIPESYGASVRILRLTDKGGFLPDPDELRSLVTAKTKMICINNPNNPSGALMPPELIDEIVTIAREAGAYLLCDEVYRHLTQGDAWCPSVADLYEKGISISSMSKVFSLAGLRLGWIACRDEAVIRSCLSHRDYNLISCGMFDDAVASIALAHGDAVLGRSRAIIRENLKILDRWVNEEPLLRYVKPEAGTTALVFYDLDIPSMEFCKRMLDETGALVTPGACFEMEHCMRIGYACEAEELANGLAAVSAWLKTL